MKKHMGFALCLLGTALVILSGLLWSVDYIGTDPGLYHKLQMEAGILEYAGISEETLVDLNHALARCLEGDAHALENLEADVFGQAQPAFNERELIHMEDCRRLFVLADRVQLAAKACGALALAAGFMLLKDRRKISRACGLGPLALVAPLGALAVWAALDFDAAFCFFHEVLFTNDLWLLDPRTDLLIRICPQSMFVSMGMRIGVMGLAFALAVPLLLAAVASVLSKGKLIDDGDVK